MAKVAFSVVETGGSRIWCITNSADGSGSRRKRGTRPEARNRTASVLQDACIGRASPFRARFNRRLASSDLEDRLDRVVEMLSVRLTTGSAKAASLKGGRSSRAGPLGHG